MLKVAAEAAVEHIHEREAYRQARQSTSNVDVPSDQPESISGRRVSFPTGGSARISLIGISSPSQSTIRTRTPKATPRKAPENTSDMDLSSSSEEDDVGKDGNYSLPAGQKVKVKVKPHGVISPKGEEAVRAPQKVTEHLPAPITNSNSNGTASKSNSKQSEISKPESAKHQPTSSTHPTSEPPLASKKRHFLAHFIDPENWIGDMPSWAAPLAARISDSKSLGPSLGPSSTSVPEALSHRPVDSPSSTELSIPESASGAAVVSGSTPGPPPTPTVPTLPPTPPWEIPTTRISSTTSSRHEPSTTADDPQRPEVDGCAPLRGTSVPLQGAIISELGSSAPLPSSPLVTGSRMDEFSVFDSTPQQSLEVEMENPTSTRRVDTLLQVGVGAQRHVTLPVGGAEDTTTPHMDPKSNQERNLEDTTITLSPPSTIMTGIRESLESSISISAQTPPVIGPTPTLTTNYHILDEAGFAPNPSSAAKAPTLLPGLIADRDSRSPIANGMEPPFPFPSPSNPSAFGTPPSETLKFSLPLTRAPTSYARPLQHVPTLRDWIAQGTLAELPTGTGGEILPAPQPSTQGRATVSRVAGSSESAPTDSSGVGTQAQEQVVNAQPGVGSRPITVDAQDALPSSLWRSLDGRRDRSTSLSEFVPPAVSAPQLGTSAPLDPIEDGMTVDEIPVQSTLARPSISIDQLLEATGSKSTHTIQLIRHLLQFLRVSAQERPTSGTVIDMVEIATAYTSSALLSRPLPCLVGNGAVPANETLILLAKVSEALLKDFGPYRGSDLTSRIDSLDQLLAEEIVNIQGLVPDEHHMRVILPHSRILVEKEVSAVSYTSLSQDIQPGDLETRPPAPSSSVSERSMDVPRSMGVNLSPDATMVDLSSLASFSNAPDLSKYLKEEPSPNSHKASVPAASTIMTSMMRNMADLLECASGSTSSRKGKEREFDRPHISHMTEASASYDSPVVSALLDEFRSMKDELRQSQQRSREEISAIKHELRLKEHKGRTELDAMRQRHQEELETLRYTIHLMERDKEQASDAGDDTRIPALDILDLRRRITSLEGQTRSGIMTPERSLSGAPVPGMDVTFIRRSNHPLGHLLDYDDSFASGSSHFPLSSGPNNSTPKPGNSIQLPFTGMDVDETIPLPIKSQRKFSAVHRPTSG